MQVHQNYQLREFNTFGIEAIAKYFATFSSSEQLGEILASKKIPLSLYTPLILGGGSNILLIKDQEVVLKNEILGINIAGEDDEYVYLQAGGGVCWHDLVLFCISNNYGGIENLSLIPGNVGAAPMQNIGAYGVELKDVFHELNAFHLKERKLISFNSNECEFGYRDSVFKRNYKGQFAILDITLKLRKQPIINISYAALQNALSRMSPGELNIRAVSEAVISIRKSKLPDPKIIGNAGSFFKNPEILNERYKQLMAMFTGLIAYPLENGNWKLAAGWLIEQCGYKGFRRGNTGCYISQALVLVNYGGAKGEEIYHLSEEIIQSVYSKFGLLLDREVNVLE